jgi:hypothetical protein
MGRWHGLSSSSSSSSSADQVRPYARRRGKNVRADNFDEPARGPARPDLVEIVARLGWRYRHQLAPFYVALGQAMLASLGHDYAPRWWPLVLLVGTWPRPSRGIGGPTGGRSRST